MEIVDKKKTPPYQMLNIIIRGNLRFNSQFSSNYFYLHLHLLLHLVWRMNVMSFINLFPVILSKHADEMISGKMPKKHAWQPRDVRSLMMMTCEIAIVTLVFLLGHTSSCTAAENHAIIVTDCYSICVRAFTPCMHANICMHGTWNSEKVIDVHREKKGKAKSFFTRERERESRRLRRGNLVTRWWQTA